MPAAGRSRRLGSMLLRTVPIAGVLGALLWLLLPRNPWSPDEIRGLGGSLARMEVLARSTTPSGLVREELRLVGDNGLVLTCRVEHPLRAASALPGLVLLGGIQAGRRALDHVAPPELPLIRLSFDYPYVPPARFPGPAGFLRALPRAERGARATVGGLLLALDYLRSRPDVDPRRITVAGASLGAAAAVIAGSADPGCAGVAVLYGGGDLRRVVAANLPWGPGWFRSVMSRSMNPWLARLEPTRYAARISPRPLLMVNGTGDRIIPRDSVRALFEAAKEPKELRWLETGHKVIDEEDVMPRLVGMVLDWMNAHDLLEPASE